MTTAERMALAVLNGDLGAARALADLLSEEYGQGAREVLPAFLAAWLWGRSAARRPMPLAPPLRRFTVPLDRLRVVVYFPLLPREVEFDREETARMIREWLHEGQPLFLQGADRVEVFEVAEAPDPRRGLPVGNPGGWQSCSPGEKREGSGDAD